MFIDLFASIQSCFQFDIPQVPDVDLNWNIHELYESTSKEIIEFKKRETFNPHTKIEFPDEDKSILIQENQSDAQKKAKKTLFQTIYEIMCVYPKTQKSSIAYSICFDEYLRYIAFLKDDEIYSWLPKFKISCWKAADVKMNEKKFFK